MRLPRAGAADLSSWPEFKEHLDEFVEDKLMERCALKKCKYKEVTKMQVSEAGGFGGRWCLIAARCLFSSASCRGRAEVGDTRLQ